MKILLFTALFLISAGLSAQDSTYNISMTGANIGDIDMATLANGEVVIVGTQGSLVYYQFIDTTGSIKGDLIPVLDDKQNQGSQPKITSLAGGGFVICWIIQSQPNSGRDLIARVFDESGSPTTASFKINNISGVIRFPSITSISDKNIVICWDGDVNLYARIVDKYGIAITDQFQVNTTQDQILFASYLSVIPTFSGGFLIGWDYLFEGIYYQQFDSMGNKIGDIFLIEDRSAWRNPFFYSLGENGFLIVYIDNDNNVDNDGDKNVYIQQFDLSGNIIIPKKQISFKTVRDPLLPTICRINNSNYIVVWNQNITYDWSYKSNIYAQMLDSNFALIKSNFKVNDDGYECHFNETPHVATLGDSKFITAYDLIFDESIHYYKYYFQDPIHHTLQQFELISPENGENLFTFLPTLEWSEASSIRKNFPWEITYSLYLDTDENFSAPEIFNDIQESYFFTDTLELGETYYWKVFAESNYNDTLWNYQNAAFHIDPMAPIENDASNNPVSYGLSQNYPNPFNPSTTINFALARAGNTEIILYDALGRKIKSLVNDYRHSGYHSIRFNSGNLSSGVYYYRIVSGDFTETKKMLLLR